jgi:hypothetical protein
MRARDSSSLFSSAFILGHAAALGCAVAPVKSLVRSQEWLRYPLPICLRNHWMTPLALEVQEIVLVIRPGVIPGSNGGSRRSELGTTEHRDSSSHDSFLPWRPESFLLLSNYGAVRRKPTLRLPQRSGPGARAVFVSIRPAPGLSQLLPRLPGVAAQISRWWQAALPLA